ncbi:MAG: TatD family hydrolase [Thermomicrobiales bacterium]|nr:TatD family hydrolase [Thermomicrobiales bacterium]
MFIDTHAHLDLDQFPDVESVIESAVAAGVGRIINIGFGPKRWPTTLALAKRFPQIACTLGFHPGDADKFNPESADRLVELVRATNPVGIGEAGIDLHWPNNPALDLQRAAFAFQIDLALEHDLPLVIHQRAAEAEVAEQLEAADARLRVVLHSFDGTERLQNLALDRGWYIGIGGLMTRRTAPVRELLHRVPLDRFVLETDSPFLVPSGIESRRNEPANVPVIAERFAGLRGLPLDAIAAAARRNALAAFPRLVAVPAALEPVS